MKVHLLDESYAYIQKIRNFTGDSKMRFREIKDFGLGRLSTHATMLQDVGILPTLVSFHPKGCFGSISTLRSRLALFSALRGCLTWVKTTLIAILRPFCG